MGWMNLGHRAGSVGVRGSSPLSSTCVTSERRGFRLLVGRVLLVRCCAEDGGRPSGAVLRRGAPNHRVLHWLKTVVVSDAGKGALEVSGRDQEDGAQSRWLVAGVAVDVSLEGKVTSKPGSLWSVPG
jgi:hypothetical protein